MTTAYRREPCGHEKRAAGRRDDAGRRGVRCYLGTRWERTCPGFTYVPWAEVEEALRTIADGNLNQDEAMDTAVAALTRPGSEVLEPFRRNLRSEG